jgi:carnitine-CoA ligase
VHRETNQIGNWLMSLGFGKGAHVAVMMDNIPNCLLLHVALAKIGAVSVPINVSARGGMLAHHLKAADVEAIITTASYAETAIRRRPCERLRVVGPLVCD